jgi:hypothetical protein
VPEHTIDSVDLAVELERQWMRKAIAHVRQTASMMLEGPFQAGMETACDEIEARCNLASDSSSSVKEEKC